MSFVKAPDDTLDYEWDWSVWMPTGDTISTVSFTAADGITIESSPAPSNTTTTATIWLGGGTSGDTYDVTCQITTAAGRIAQWSQPVNIIDL